MPTMNSCFALALANVYPATLALHLPGRKLFAGEMAVLHRYHEQKKSNPYLLFGDLGIARPRIVFGLRKSGAATIAAATARAVSVARFLIRSGLFSPGEIRVSFDEMSQGT
jgi:hypothetical protein